MVFVGLFVPETLRALVGNGSGYANPTPFQWLHQRRHPSTILNLDRRKPFQYTNFLKPFQYLLFPDVILILLLGGLSFMAYYTCLVTTTKQFSLHYDLTAFQIGFCFLSQGGGTIVGSFIHGKILDRDFKKTKTERPDLGEVPFYFARLKHSWWYLVTQQVITLVYGWAYYLNAPLAVMLILQFIGKVD